MGICKLEIPYKFPSFNEYVNECRRNRYAGGSMKKRIEEYISYYINKLPYFNKSVKIKFIWIENNKRRDFDNICYDKKFILDSMVKAGKLKDDNRNYVVGFEDSFEYADESKVILEIDEVK